MNELIPEVTEAEVLAGSCTRPVKLRDGSEVAIGVKALPWRVALITGAMFVQGQIAEGVIKVLQHSLGNDASKDSFLDKLVPSELTRLANLANQLSNGMDSAKKPMANQLAQTEAPASPIGSPSSVS